MINSQWFWLLGIMLAWAGAAACLGGSKIFWDYDEFKETDSSAQ